MDENQTEQPLIELSAAIGSETHREFYLFNFTRSAYKLPPLQYILLAALLAATLICGLAAKAPLWAGMPPALLLLGVLALCGYHYLLAPAVEYKRFGPLATNTYHYSFYNDRFDYSVQGTSERGEVSVEYNVFRVIYETNTGFYIYLLDGRAFLISKKQITPDQTVYLRGFFAGKFIKKFKCLSGENAAV
jgi:hypothetical protein